jgi:lysophospholipase L1-like esterase
LFNKSTWYFLLIIAFAGFVSLALGFMKSMQVSSSAEHSSAVSNVIKTETISNKTENNTTKITKDPNSIKMLIIGDSIAFGTGDEKSKGLSGYLVDYLKPQTTKKLSADNIGINGLRSNEFLEQLQSDNVKTKIATSDVLVISIGGNDLREMRSERNNTVNQNDFKSIEDNYLKNMQDSLTAIRKINSNAYVVFLGLYNPYEISTSSAEDLKYMNTWNSDTQKIFEGDDRIIIIPTYDIFKYNLNRFLAPDGLHPNSLGYQMISNRIAKSIESIFSK